ncbi:glycine zipper domain-containing protein [Caballeronia sp. LZ019]|uniref:glycine zipper domain-containing protein n=1 Tax=Caballeronia sp. LZ019 TaxID=3038555 RepID=UPI0028664E5C|nr:glycine zipper domain-containing protein [Caballeronia sp. LZ019]MDR5809279.1 YMGG-like glycine zipper-containing protein [Caballeronia sp. LZ019]
MLKVTILVGALLASPVAFAQKPVVYPAHGQSAQRQAQDDGACYVWAKNNTGVDPAVVAGAPPPVVGPTGARVRGAARGAAAGAIIGDVNHHDPGHGAALGATAGALVGGVRSRQLHAAQAQYAQASQQSTLNLYWRAYSACMQGKGYSVQ